jgi:hypothetical protein
MRDIVHLLKGALIVWFLHRMAIRSQTDLTLSKLSLSYLDTTYEIKGVFDIVPDSLRNRNVSVSSEKWFSIESESHCEIVWLICWNVSDLVEMRKKWIRITWNTYFVISRLQYKNLKRFKPIHLWNVSMFYPLEPLQVIQAWIRNVSPCQTGPNSLDWTFPYPFMVNYLIKLYIYYIMLEKNLLHVNLD